MRKSLISLEDIQLDASLNSVDPVTVAMVDEPGAIVSMDGLDQSGLVATQNVSNGVEVVTTLESMAHHLRRQKPSAVGSLGVQFANIAIEEICARVGISLEEMPIGPLNEASQDDVLSAGADKIDELKASAVEKTEGALLDMVSALINKRESVCGIIANLRHRIDEVREDINRAKEGGVATTPRIASVEEDAVAGLMPIFYDLSKVGEKNSFTESYTPVYGVLNKASSVVSDLTHFLTEHTHLYKRIIKRQTDWICDHKDNILKNSDGINQYSFNPDEFQIAGSTYIGEKSMPTVVRYVGPFMPGAVRFTTILGSVNTLFGFDALQAIEKSSTELRCTIVATDNQIQMDPTPVPVLSLEEIEARLMEVERGLEALDHWASMAYAKLWKDALFEDMVIGNLLKKDALSSGDRSLSMLAASVMTLLNQAGVDVPQYSIRVLSSVVFYAEYSMKQYAGAES